MGRFKNSGIILFIVLIALVLFYSCNSKKKLSYELLNSAYRGDIEKVKELIEEDGIDVNYMRPDEGETALKKAVVRGHSNVVRYLIKHGADIEAADPTGATPIMDAAFGDEVNLKILIAAGAYVDAKDNDGATSLFRATYKNKVGIVKRLIRSHTDVNHKDKNGMTALKLAEIRGYKEIVKMLKAAGATE